MTANWGQRKKIKQPLTKNFKHSWCLIFGQLSYLHNYSWIISPISLVCPGQLVTWFTCFTNHATHVGAHTHARLWTCLIKIHGRWMRNWSSTSKLGGSLNVRGSRLCKNFASLGHQSGKCVLHSTLLWTQCLYFIFYTLYFTHSIF